MTRDDIRFLPATEMRYCISRQDLPAEEITEAIINTISGYRYDAVKEISPFLWFT